MEYLLKKQYLHNCIKVALEEESKYIGILIQLPDCRRPEVIINPAINFEKKWEYYDGAYNNELELRFNPKVKIVGFTHADSFAEIESCLLNNYCE